MADLRYAGFALYAMIFYTLLQISVAPNGKHEISLQSGDLVVKDLQMDADELVLKSNPRQFRATREKRQEMRARDKIESSPSDVRLRLVSQADERARGEGKAGSEFRTANHTGGEYTSAIRERDPTTGIQSWRDAPSKQSGKVTENQTNFAGDSSKSIACTSDFTNNCQHTRSKVNKPGLKLEDGIRNVITKGESVGGDGKASIRLSRKMNALKFSTRRSGDPSRRMEGTKTDRVQAQYNYHVNDSYSSKDLFLSNRLKEIMNESNRIHDKYELFRDGIFWSENVEKLLPNRSSEAVVNAWRYDVQSQRVVRLLPGCGRDNNRLAILENGEKLCCRYRQNIDQIQGEILSFHLSRLIGIENLPLGVLLKIKPDSEQWELVKENITAAGWKKGRIIVATKWIPDLEPCYIPTELKGFNGTLGSELFDKLDLTNLKSPPQHLIELIQWSDLAIFDYITANLDRIVNTLVNLQWNRYMLKQPVHNLEVSKTDRGLWFLDNESGLRHGYRMLDKFGHFHDQILKSVCLFRFETLQKLRRLSEEPYFWELFISAVESQEPLFENFPSYPPKFRDVLKNRIKNVVEHAEHCKQENLRSL